MKGAKPFWNSVGWVFHILLMQILFNNLIYTKTINSGTWRGGEESTKLKFKLNTQKSDTEFSKAGKIDWEIRNVSQMYIWSFTLQFRVDE